MKKDKKWLSEGINELIDGYTSFGGHQHLYISKKNIDKLYHLIDQLDEPEKVVIPKFVADWWDGDSVTMYGGERINKKYKLRLISGFHDRGLGDYLSKVEDWLDENDSAFLDLVNGKPYEIEKEKLYYVLNKKGFLMMRKYEGEIDTMRISSTLSIDGLGDASNYLLTEKEIKDYDERYWPFAVEVEE